MANQKFKDALLEIYHGEQLGEAFFSTLLQEAENDHQHYILGALLQLETEGKAKIRPVLVRYGLSLSDNTQSIAEGVKSAQEMQAMPWSEKFAAMAAYVKAQALPQYEALAGMVGEDEDEEARQIAHFLGEHERRVLAVAENVVAGDNDPAAVLMDFLHFPLKPPGTA